MILIDGRTSTCRGGHGGWDSFWITKRHLEAACLIGWQESLVLQRSKPESCLIKFSCAFYEVFLQRIYHSVDVIITPYTVTFLLYTNPSNSTAGVKPTSRRPGTLQEMVSYSVKTVLSKKISPNTFHPIWPEGILWHLVQKINTTLQPRLFYYAQLSKQGSVHNIRTFTLWCWTALDSSKKQSNWEKNVLKDAVITESGQRTRLKSQVSGCSCHMDRHEADGVWSERRDRQEWERKRARGNKESEGCCSKEQQTSSHSAPVRPSVVPRAWLCQSSLVKKKKNNRGARHPAANLRLWCRHPAHSETGHRGRLSARAEWVCGNNPSPPLCVDRFSNLISARARLLHHLCSWNRALCMKIFKRLLPQREEEKKKSILGYIQTGYAEPQAQPHRLAR